MMLKHDHAQHCVAYAEWLATQFCRLPIEVLLEVINWSWEEQRHLADAIQRVTAAQQLTTRAIAIAKRF
jgi:hypothetical protein